MKLKHLLLCLPVLSCGASDAGTTAQDEPLLDDSGEIVVRIDGSSEDDGMFASQADHDEFCLDNPESKWCSSIGTAEQAWRSAEYWGFDASHNCYNRSGTPCTFPQSLNFKLHVNAGQCLVPGLPTATAQAIFDAFMEGLLAWNGVGGAAVTVTNAGGAQFIAVECKDLPGTTLAQDINNGNTHVQLADLPTGAHGQNPTSAVQYDGSTIQIDVQQIFNVMTSPNGCNKPTPTIAQLKQYAKRIAMHEMGHAAGFAHFTGANLMNAFASCTRNDTPTSVPQFAAALRVYSGTNSAATIDDVDLELLGQQ